MPWLSRTGNATTASQSGTDTPRLNTTATLPDTDTTAVRTATTTVAFLLQNKVRRPKSQRPAESLRIANGRDAGEVEEKSTQGLAHSMSDKGCFLAVLLL